MTSLSTAIVKLEEAKLSRTERAYAPIWKMLRKKKQVTLAVLDPSFVPRLKRMISKEKDEDVGFKLLNEIEKPRLRYSWNEEKKELKVELVSRINVTEIEG